MDRGIPRGQPFPKENNIGVGEENVVGVFLTGVAVLTHGVVRDSNVVHELVGGESVVLKNPEEGFQLIGVCNFQIQLKVSTW